ncbi:serine/arginine repetitive matrix protein 1 [Clonorchis sinensis]|uniref:Serine/arginine repetitive matrix protein 1 n=1 Tax=Clonorchis sinensis TaxID=79923 RepID=G7YCX6_CLOSI|nr:serine/arginine repetitive matrix protein 1 [Clonorchis sinensis]
MTSLRTWIQLFERRTECAAHPDPKEIQINITGFLNSKNARVFLTELWDLLLSAMENPEGVPSLLLDAKKAEILQRQVAFFVALICIMGLRMLGFSCYNFLHFFESIADETVREHYNGVFLSH